MAKFYVYDNASRRLKSGGFTYSFDVVAAFGGGWRGVLRLEDQAYIDELAKFAARVGVREITEAEYDELLKKKLNSQKPKGDIIRLPASPLKTGVGHVAVKDPSSPTTPKVKVEGPAEPPFKIGEAPFVDVLEKVTKKRGKK